MNIPFAVGRGGADRLAFLTRPHDVAPNMPRPYVDDHDDRTPLSPRSIVDLEAQRPGGQAEMAERSTPTARFIHRFRPAIPSFFSTVSSWRGRPTSSRYSGDGLPPDTVVNGDETPKTPQFRIGVQDLPSTRLYLPNLTRTWTDGSNGPPSRPATSHAAGARSPGVSGVGVDEIAQPSPAVLAAGTRPGSRGRRRAHGAEAETDGADVARERHGRRHRHRREGSDRSRQSERSNRSGRSRRTGERSQEESRGSEDREERRRRRRRRRERQEGSRGDASGSGSQDSNRSTPKRFLFCFPWVKSRRIRSQILRCIVSGLFLTLILTVCEWPCETYQRLQAYTRGRSLLVDYQEHQQQRVYGSPDPHHPLYHHFLLPRPDPTVHDGCQRPKSRRGQPSTSRDDGARRICHPKKADSGCPGARRGGCRYRKRGDQDEPTRLRALAVKCGMCRSERSAGRVITDDRCCRGLIPIASSGNATMLHRKPSRTTTYRIPTVSDQGSSTQNRAMRGQRRHVHLRTPRTTVSAMSSRHSRGP